MIGKTTLCMRPYQPPGIMYYGTERGFARTTDVHIRNPRAKIESDPKTRGLGGSAAITVVYPVDWTLQVRSVFGSDANPLRQVIGDAALMGQIAGRVVTLSDQRGHAKVLTMLAPRHTGALGVSESRHICAHPLMTSTQQALGRNIDATNTPHTIATAAHPRLTPSLPTPKPPGRPEPPPRGNRPVPASPSPNCSRHAAAIRPHLRPVLLSSHYACLQSEPPWGPRTPVEDWRRTLYLRTELIAFN